MKTRKTDHTPVSENEEEKEPRKTVRKSGRQKIPFLVGNPAKMPENKLPTRADTIKHFLYLNEKKGPHSKTRLFSCALSTGFRNIFQKYKLKLNIKKNHL